MDEKRRSLIYAALRKYTVTVEYKDIPDNQYIYKKMCECSAYLTEVGKISLEVRKAFSESEKRFRAENQNLRILRNQTLTTNDRIKKLPTGREREAAVDDLLEANVIDVENLETEMRALKELKDAVREHLNIIKNSHMTAKDLLKAYDVPVSKLNLGRADDPEVADLHKTFAEVDKLESEEIGDETESSVEVDDSDEFDGGEIYYEDEDEDNNDDEFDDVETSSSNSKDDLMQITDSLINDTDVVTESVESLDGSEIQVLAINQDTDESEIQVLEDSKEDTDSSPGEVSETAEGNNNPTGSSGDQMDDDLGDLSSFLTEDSYVSGLDEDSEETESDRDEEEDSKVDESKEKGQGSSDDLDLSDVDISEEKSSDEVKEKELPSVQVELNDIGIDLEVGEDSESDSSEDASKDAIKEETQDTISEPEEHVKSTESEPVLEEDTGESDGSDKIDDLDLDDILADMDIGDG